MTVISVAAQADGRYCEDSDSPYYAHVWVGPLSPIVPNSSLANKFQVLVIESIAVTVAMYCLIQFYIQIKNDIAHHRPFLKILCIKLVIFLSFWQSVSTHIHHFSLFGISLTLAKTIIDFLTSSGTIKSSAKVQLFDWNNGLPNLLICIEMFLFAILHFWGFPWGPYMLNKGDIMSNGSDQRYYGGFLGIKAFLDAMNPWDLIKATARGFRWLFVGRKHRELDPSYEMPKREPIDGSEVSPVA